MMGFGPPQPPQQAQPDHPENTATVEHDHRFIRTVEAFNAMVAVWNTFTHHGMSTEARALAVQPVADHLAVTAVEFVEALSKTASTELRLASIERASQNAPE